jgi:hypothetical protein
MFHLQVCLVDTSCFQRVIILVLTFKDLGPPGFLERLHHALYIKFWIQKSQKMLVWLSKMVLAQNKCTAKLNLCP